eukprot:jgi/Psemu1/294444/fgenesh1_pm.19_\
MEQLVLGIFQEQLAKVIIGFRKEQVNANLLNGKGEIRDVSLNCNVLNENLAKVCPYVQLEEIHVSRIGFHVSSWANLRKAPIIVDIGHVVARMQESLTLLPKNERQGIAMITEAELIQKLSEGFKPFSFSVGGGGSYGTIDRIVDNLVVEVESFRLEVQTCGKFKTKRPGPWTPPLFQTEMKNLKLCMVDAEGSEGTPDQVWAHNRSRRDYFRIYKKISGECKIKLLPQNQSCDAKRKRKGALEQELANLTLEIQIAVERRLRDGAILACQFDITIPEVDVDIDSSDMRQLAHFASGLQHCLAKDKSFEDPLKPLDVSSTPPPPSSSSSQTVGSPTPKNQLNRNSAGSMDDSVEYNDDNDANSITENLDASSIQDGGSVASSGTDDGTSDDDDSSVIRDESSSAPGTPRPLPGNRSGSHRPVIILPNNMVIYNSISVTCSIHDLILRGSYKCGGDTAYLEFNAKGCITEVIWPKVNREHGLYAQLSTSFVSLQERVGHHRRTLLMGGMHRDDHLSRHLPSRKPKEVCADDFFPLFERRGIRDDPLDLRHLFPTQAFGLKSTIDIFSSQTKDNETVDNYMVFHELGVDEMDVVLDTTVLLRITRFLMDMDGEGFDPRWETGDWIDLLTPDMLHDPSETLHLSEHIQECTQLFLDENLMISSDLFNVTARLSNVEVRIPSSVRDSLRSCDIILKWEETTFVVSSALPRTFLTGRIGNSISGDTRRGEENVAIDFPNDPSDICYRFEQGLTGQDISTFRFQLTTRGFEVNAVPVIPFCVAPEAQKLFAVAESTLIFSFEGEPPSVGSNKMKITVFLSVLIHQIILNLDFDILAGATSTLLCHKNNIFTIVEMLGDTTANYQNAPSEQNNDKIKQSMKGRRILAKRHMTQSRETGGLVVIFSLQQRHFRLKVWRQNVPIHSPLRNESLSNSSKSQNDQGSIDLLTLVDYGMTDLEVGVEFDFHSNSGHRTVVKSYVKDVNLKVVDLAKEIEEYQKQKSSTTGSSTAKEEDDSAALQRNLIDLCSFGNESLPCGLDPSGRAQHFAFRLEAHHKNDSQSWSMAADISAPSTINLDIKAVKTTILLIIEALLLPAWSKDPMMEKDAVLFPPGTIGAMFCSVGAVLLAADQNVDLVDWNNLEIDTDSRDPIVERVLRSICKVCFPSNLQVILLRCEVANVIISIPCENKDEEEQSSKLSFLLHQSDIITRFYPIPGSPPSEIEQVLACKGTDWSTLINTDNEGFYQRILSRQSLLSMTEEQEGTTSLEKIVHPFEICLSYSGATVDFSMNKGILVDDIRLIENIQSRLNSAMIVSVECFSEICDVLRAITPRVKNKHVSEGQNSSLDDENFEGGNNNLDGESSAVFSTRQILRRAHQEFSIYEHDVRSRMQRKDNELEAIKIDLFHKERERVGALSLMSSRVAGWVRMGGQHRSGQRVVKKSLLWPFWAILRRELLILYPRPGEPKPSDIISLVNARIRNLSGGSSRQDTKRGFAIVESSGVVRYFVTGNAQEYELWTKEISFTIKSYSSTKEPSDRLEAVESNASEYMEAGMDDDKDIAAETSQRNSRIGNRLSSAFQSARLKSKEMVDRRQYSVITDRSAHGGDSSIFSTAVSEGSESNGGSFRGLAEDSSLGSSKRVEISKKLSGVGQVTKSRLGSALQNARQKREEISNRLISEKNLDAQDDLNCPPADPDSIDQDIDGWQSGQRTPLKFGNKLGSALQNARIMAKGSVEKQGRLSNLRGKLGGLAQGRSDDTGQIQSDSEQLSPYDTSANNGLEKSLSYDFSTVIDEDDSNPDELARHRQKENSANSSTPSITSLLEGVKAEDAEIPGPGDSSFSDTAYSAISSVRGRDPAKQMEKNRRSSRFTFRKQQDNFLDDSLFGGESLTLKNIFVGQETTSSFNAPHLDVKTFSPLKEKWIVAVSEIAKTSETRVIDNNSELSAEAEIATVEDVNSVKDDANKNSQQNETQRDVPRFLVKLLRIHSGQTEEPCEKQWSFGDVLKFYAGISEAIEEDLPQLVGERRYVSDQASALSSGTLSNSALAEKMVVWGRTLGGLLAAGELSECIEGLGQYQCEAIETFLNSLLECPLPDSGLAFLSKTLGISCPMETIESSTDDSTPDAGESNKPATESDEPKQDATKKPQTNLDFTDPGHRSGAILNLLSACDAELGQVETRAAATEGIQPIRVNKNTTGTHSAVKLEPIFYDPLLPPSLIDHIHSSLHDALTNVQAERDEMHAQLIGANVMHTHSLERMRKKMERLEISATLSQQNERDRRRHDFQAPNIATMFGKNDQRVERLHQEIDRNIAKAHHVIRNDDADVEMMQLCSQLAGEISTRTSHALEIERLERTREAERKTQIAEKDALKAELKRAQELLEMERKKSSEASAEAARWKSLYEKCHPEDKNSQK